MTLLTKRKEAWASKRKPDMLLGTPINASAIVAARYYETLRALIEDMTAETERSLRRLFNTDHAEEYFAQDASTSSQARILTNALMKKFNKKFGIKAKPTAERFAKQADKASSANVYTSIKQLSGGLSLPTTAITKEMTDILNATVTENVALIKSISQEYLSGVQQAVMRSITTGNGLQDLMPYLEKHKDISLRRAHLIALDQNRKASANLGRARMQNLGVEEYKWLHTGGSDHPRELHVRMSGNVYRWDDPPIIDESTQERGIPGQAINCRCRAVPVIKFAD